MAVATESALADVWYRSTRLDVASGRGCIVVTTDGEEYLDFSSGIGVTSTGHCHPVVVDAIRRQAGTFVHAQVNTYRHPLLEQAAARLREITPGSVERFFFSNSGAEAVEGAVKLARHATGRPNVIVFQRGFHGRTALTMAMTSSKVGYRAGYGPHPAGIHVAPFPYPFRTGETPDESRRRCIAAIEEILATQTAPADTAAVVVEPILGEGGYVVPPAGFLTDLAELCATHGILLVLDEVQTGMGRTGAFFAAGHFAVEPDILVTAKGLASGFPIAAVGARAHLMDRWVQGSHGGTYGGNPIGCAAVLATIDVIEQERLLDNAAERGAQLRAGLEVHRDRFAVGSDLRGIGLMQALELVDEHRHPDPQRAAAVIRHCLDNRLILLSCGAEGNVIRFIPPLIATAEEVGRALDAVGDALEATPSR